MRPVDKIREWLGIAEDQKRVALAHEQIHATIAINKRDYITERHNDQANIRLTHERLRKEIKEAKELADSTVEERVKNEMIRLQSAPQRHVACPRCGKGFALEGLGIPHHAKSATIVCDKCGSHFEIRPSMFWDKIEVELR